MSKPFSPIQAAVLADSAYATLGSRTPGVAAGIEAGANRDLFDIDNATILKGVTGFDKETNFGYCAFGKSGSSREHECLISVRGTNMPSGADWLTNSKFAGARGPNGFMVHLGFNQLASGILPQIEQAMKNKNPSTIHLAGHSLGGAAATLLADSMKDHTQMYLYTFGAPRAGGIDHAAYLSQKLGENNIFRVYHDTDPVPMVPVFPYGHCPSGKPGYLLKGSGMIIWPWAHQMGLYRSNSGDGWGSLSTIAHRRFSLDTVDDVLQQAGALPGGMLSALLMRLIVKALGMILEAAGAAVGFALLGAATIADQIAYIISKGIQIAGTTANTMTTLVEQIMRFLGIVVQQSVSFSYAFLRWLMSKLYQTMAQLARQALRQL